ncbi:MAG: sporulation integral membrane protein YlbJ [Clostridia bacterium]|nr:sporulation integral membrane protein YlbJ [Clostridia bacterium]
MYPISIKKNRSILIIKALLVFLLCSTMVVFPRETFQASLRGFNAWLTLVFPALLPFFIMSELLMGLGVVHFMGVLLEPIMRPVFNVPGTGAFVMAMGYTSGAPIGTMLSVELRKKNLCTRMEAERLMSFTNNSSPLFIFGAVAVGMFNNPALGLILAFSHYSANLIVGILLRFFGERDHQKINDIDNKKGLLITRALKALMEAQVSDGRPFGTLLADSIKKSVQTLTLIGGFIILFSVITEIISTLGIMDLFIDAIILLIKPLGMDSNAAPALAVGFFEITLGIKSASESEILLPLQLIAASAIMGWGGLSIHAQVASLAKGTDIRMKTYISARIMHSLISALIMFLSMGSAAPAITNLFETHQSMVGIFSGGWAAVVLPMVFFLAICFLGILASLLIYLCRSFNLIFINKR